MYKWLFENKKEVFRCVKPHRMQLAIVAGKYLHRRFVGRYDEYVEQSIEHVKCVSRASVVELAMNLNFLFYIIFGESLFSRDAWR